MHESKQLARWRKSIGTNQPAKQTARPASLQINSLASMTTNLKGLSKKQKIALMVLFLVAAGVSIYYIKEKYSQKDDISPGRKLLQSGGLKEHHQACTMQSAVENFTKRTGRQGNFFKEKHPTNRNNAPNKTLTQVELRQILGKKIIIDESSIPYELLNNYEIVKSDIIDYFLSDCDQQLLYFVKSPVTMRLIPTIDMERPLDSGKFVGTTNTINIKFPLREIIVKGPNCVSPYEQIVRTLRHEIWHVIVSAIESGKDCDVTVEVNQHKVGLRSTNPLLCADPKLVENAIDQGDKRLFDKLGKLVAKKNKKGFNHLSPQEQAQFSRYQQKFTNYIPKRTVASIQPEFLETMKQDGTIEKISRGIPYKTTNRNRTIFVDEIHYEFDPNGREKIIGTGYHVENPSDKLNAIVTDTQWRKNHLAKDYESRGSANSDPFPLIITEQDASLKEMGQEVIEEFYEEWNTMHLEQENQSSCQIVNR
jgi:hypothetical protein